MRELHIDGVRIADDTPCYVIAEIGHNHQGRLDICKEMFQAAKWAGCNAVKLQKRDNKALYTPEFYNSPYNSENAFGPTYGAHREALEFDATQYQELQSYAKALNLTFFATAFDIPSAAILADLEFPCLKIASGDLRNTNLLEYVRDCPWVIILSTGGAGASEIRRAYDTVRPDALLHCTSGYPAKYSELNLRCIRSMRATYDDVVVGWSGHDTGIAMAVAAYTLGARIIEKHFTLDRSWKGTDQAFSLEPQGMRTMVENLRQAHLALGDGIKTVYDSEIEPLKKQMKNPYGQIDGKTQVPHG